MLNKRHTQQAAFHCSPKVTQQESAFLCLQLWALGQSGELQLLNMFAQTASPVQSITLHPSKQSILMAVTDGTISLWQLDTLGELYRYKHEGCVEGLSFTDTDDFYFFSGPQVWHEHYGNLTGTFYKRLQQTWLAVAVNMLSPLTCMTQKQAYFEAPAISPSMLHHCLCKQHLLQSCMVLQDMCLSKTAVLPLRWSLSAGVCHASAAPVHNLPQLQLPAPPARPVGRQLTTHEL